MNGRLTTANALAPCVNRGSRISPLVYSPHVLAGLPVPLVGKACGASRCPFAAPRTS